MIYFIFAMKAEAQPFIEKLGLKKNTAYRRMDVFEDENSVVAITGTGILRAAMSVTELLSTMEISKSDILVNVGICGMKSNPDGKENIGDAYICNSIISCYDGRTYYPDMLYRTPFDEGRLVTVNKPEDGEQYSDTCDSRAVTLVDMEAAGVYEAAIRFMNSDQISFIKIVSDMCDGRYPKPDEVPDITGRHAEEIIKWADVVHGFRQKDVGMELSTAEKEWINEVADRHRYSVTRREMLKRKVMYSKVTGADITKEYIENIIR